jgi:hypothetical protein
MKTKQGRQNTVNVNTRQHCNTAQETSEQNQQCTGTLLCSARLAWHWPLTIGQSPGVMNTDASQISSTIGDQAMLGIVVQTLLPTLLRAGQSANSGVQELLLEIVGKDQYCAQNMTFTYSYISVILLAIVTVW